MTDSEPPVMTIQPAQGTSPSVISRRSGRRQIVVVGGGFGGLAATKALRKVDVDVTLIDRRNFHLFQPLLYQVATGGLSPANIASPLRHVLSRQKNCRVLLGDVLGFDLSRQMVQLEQAEVPFDTLIVAAGARHSYFGKDQWEPYAPGLKTIEDATAIRARVFSAFEAAERESDSAHRREWLNFVIVGGGPTGVELAGALAEIAHHSLKYDFRSIDPADAHILLVEAGPRVLAAFPPDLSEKAAASLARLQVEVRTGTLVTNVGPTRVSLKHGEETTVLATRTVLWAAGVQASPLARALAVSSGADLDRAGRITVLKDFSLPQHPEVFVIGDMAHYQHDTEHPLPGVAPAAIQAGKFVASLISARQYGKTLPTFAYRDKGSLATIGRSKAVAEIGRFRFGGFFAWVTWLFVHLMEIVTFRNRLLVLLQWAWSYFSYDRSARLITGRSGAESAPLSEPQHPTVPSDARPR